MTRKQLSSEEVAKLNESAHVERATSRTISFTSAFKSLAYNELLSGKTMRTILEEHGIDPQILGDARIWGIAKRIRDQAEREEGFTDARKQNKRKAAKQTPEQDLVARIDLLEHELAYTRQEVELLKKIQAADMEARIQWESKRRRK